jgi:hypothetical protein
MLFWCLCSAIFFHYLTHLVGDALDPAGRQIHYLADFLSGKPSMAASSNTTRSRCGTWVLTVKLRTSRSTADCKILQASAQYDAGVHSLHHPAISRKGVSPALVWAGLRL